MTLMSRASPCSFGDLADNIAGALLGKEMAFVDESPQAEMVKSVESQMQQDEPMDLLRCRLLDRLTDAVTTGTLDSVEI